MGTLRVMTKHMHLGNSKGAGSWQQSASGLHHGSVKNLRIS